MEKLDSLSKIADFFIKYINRFSLITISLCLLFFFWGLARYIHSGFGDKEREEARQVMIWGVVALFVLVSVWGLVALVKNTFNLDSSNPTMPTIPNFQPPVL